MNSVNEKIKSKCRSHSPSLETKSTVMQISRMRVSHRRGSQKSALKATLRQRTKRTRRLLMLMTRVVTRQLNYVQAYPTEFAVVSVPERVRPASEEPLPTLEKVPCTTPPVLQPICRQSSLPWLQNTTNSRRTRRRHKDEAARNTVLLRRPTSCLSPTSMRTRCLAICRCAFRVSPRTSRSTTTTSNITTPPTSLGCRWTLCRSWR